MDTLTLASPERLKELLEQAERELEAIQPQIDEMETRIRQLHELKQTRQRLLTLKMSLNALLESSEPLDPAENLMHWGHDVPKKTLPYEEEYSFLSKHKTFYPDLAFKEISQFLKQKDSLNFEMFRAVVLNGGTASTTDIKNYLIESGIKQPQTGESFENIPLTEISSRSNYLVRKGILRPLERGSFYTTLGWSD